MGLLTGCYHFFLQLSQSRFLREWVKYIRTPQVRKKASENIRYTFIVACVFGYELGDYVPGVRKVGQVLAIS